MDGRVRMTKRWIWGLLAIAATVSAQPATRRATNLAALTAHPAFFHLRPIVIVGEVKIEEGELRVSNDGISMRLLSKGNAPDGLDEIRGEFWDLGRMNADDPRLRAYDLKTAFKIDPEGAWPRPGQVTAIIASAVIAATPPAAPSIRNVVLSPSRYIEQDITLVGQFGGRNLLGDLPDAPAQSRYDFVLRSADAAIWVSNIRPRGRDFELSLDGRMDTGRWVEVTGRLQQGRGLQWLDATAGSLRLVPAPRDPGETTQIRIEPAPAPEVVFSAPTGGEIDVAPATNIRVQFSRDIDPSTFRNRVRVTYEGADPSATGLEVTTQYLPGTRVLEIKLREPLEPFRTVVVQLTEGVLGTDKQPLQPWQLTFQTGR